jgi:hypothetical protein
MVLLGMRTQGYPEASRQISDHGFVCRRGEHLSSPDPGVGQ